jgi:SAM-dependent methyltransferase
VASYDQFAPYFDAWQEDFGGPYDDLILPRLLALLERHAPAARRVADLGIGTGDLVIALARRGLAVVGVDVSRPMLAVARDKIAAAGLPTPPVLVEQDIRALTLDVPLDAVFCVYTVVNQLVEAGDLDRLLGSVARALAPGGLFVFEVNLPAAYDRFWRGDDVALAGPARIHRSHRAHPGTRVIEAQVTIEAADGSVRHDRILQRPYADAEIRAALGRGPWTVLACDPFDPFGVSEEPTKALGAVQRART